MVRRRQAEQALLREDRLRRQAYKEALDIKVFEEELEASKSRRGGANPIVETKEGLRSTDFKFSTNQNPLRFTASGELFYILVAILLLYFFINFDFYLKIKFAYNKVGYNIT